jgi:hypothetical protein
MRSESCGDARAQREQLVGRLHVERRDLLHMVEKAIALDKETCRWSILGVAAELQDTQQRQRVLKSQRQAANGLTTAEIRAGGCRSGE